jgi:hypothetical protein
MNGFSPDIYIAFEEAHSALLHYRNHDGSRHCKCLVAQQLREWDELYADEIKKINRRMLKRQQRPALFREVK